ncbi:MAG: 2-amino-4-hydroxy-6-hydroxymethyldihydropteridine diphosphokinase [Candidatus Omnitrophota bacterium]
MIKSYLGIGSNLGRRQINIKKAIELLKQLPNTKLTKISKLIETRPVGGPKQRKFLNAAIEIKTSLKPLILLKALKKIEKDLGRVKTIKNGPRVIDLDILFYNEKNIHEKNLIIPHPRMFQRDFVLKPLGEIIPESKLKLLQKRYAIN